MHDTAPRTEFALTGQQYEQAQALLKGIVTQPIALGATEQNGQYSRAVNGDGWTTERIRVSRGQAAIEADYSHGTDDTALDSERTAEFIRVVGDLPGVARAQLIVKNGKVVLADFRDDQDPANTVRDEVTAEGFENALLTIETARQELATN